MVLEGLAFQAKVTLCTGKGMAAKAELQHNPATRFNKGIVTVRRLVIRGRFLQTTPMASDWNVPEDAWENPWVNS